MQNAKTQTKDSMKVLRTILTAALLVVAATCAVAQTAYRIASVNSGKSLRPVGGSLTMGAGIEQWDYTGAACQHWYVQDVGGGKYKITNVAFRNVLDVKYDSIESGAEICLWEYVNAPSQQFYMEDAGGGKFVFRATHSGKVLDVQFDSVSNGGRIIQWDYVQVTSQQWYLIPISTIPSDNPTLPLQATLSVSATQVGIGQAVDFTITGLNGATEVGLAQCDSSGNVITWIDSGTGNSRRYSWSSSSPMTGYFKSWAKSGAPSTIVYSSLVTVSVVAPIPATKYVSSMTLFYYGPSRYVYVAGGQSVIVDQMTGYIISGRLRSDAEQHVYYGPGQFTYFARNSMISFAEGYVADGYMANSGDSELLYYGPGRLTRFYPNSHVKFAGGFVTDGYMNNSGDSELLYYGDGRMTRFEPKSHVKFKDGYVVDGYMKNGSSSAILYYGDGRLARFYPDSHILFANGFVSGGWLAESNYLTTRTGSTYVKGGVLCAFVDGYYVP